MLGKSCCSSTTSFHLAPALGQNSLRKGIARKEFSACVPERNTVWVFHCSSSPCLLSQKYESQHSWATRFFVQALVFVVLTGSRSCLRLRRPTDRLEQRNSQVYITYSQPQLFACHCPRIVSAPRVRKQFSTKEPQEAPLAKNHRKLQENHSVFTNIQNSI